jgi:hypothetical protein
MGFGLLFSAQSAIADQVITNESDQDFIIDKYGVSIADDQIYNKNNLEISKFSKETRYMYDMVESSFHKAEVDPIIYRFYASDTISLGPDGQPQFGRFKIKNSYEDLVSKYDLKLSSKHAYVKNNVGWDWVNFKLIPKDKSLGAAELDFIILYLWVRQKGKWAVHGDMYVPGKL